MCTLVVAPHLTMAQLSPAPRAGHVMASAGRGGGVFLFGGQRDTNPHLVDTLWLWNGSAWRIVSDEGPHHRGMAAMAFDTRRGVLVLYGGINGSVGSSSGTRYGDTWEWDGRRWTERNVHTPGPRDHHAMAFDEARRVMVMYGGETYDRSYSRETWTWDGSRWKMADSLTGPGGLGHHAMAYDSRRQRVVMFGGDRPRFGDRPGLRANSDTWEWDGARWERVATEGPPPISAGRMAYDAARGVTVLFGGDRTRDETWTWDGTRWEEHKVPGPSPRSVHAMAYDAKRERVVLFGGGGPGGPGLYNSFNDVLEWDGAQWVKRDVVRRHKGSPDLSTASSDRRGGPIARL
jgi:hypothetical protein